MIVACQYPEIERVADGGFAERLAYVRWLRAARFGHETDRQLAAALGVGEKWLGKWKGSVDSPEGRSEAASIEAVLGRATTAWLYDGLGYPPEADLWAHWLLARSTPDPFAGEAIPTHERDIDSLDADIQAPTRATGTSGRPGAKKRR